MSQPMKGLVQFIADLRNARTRELEVKRINAELANIRQKFTDSNLNGYQKKKYICKLLYIYILGYDVEIGHMESMSLILSPKYSEKQIGYLAISLLLNEKSDLLHLVVNSIRKDLDSLNEIHTCLALNCVSTVANRELSDALANDVFKLLISPTSSNNVRKKAALTLLKLYRINPNAIEHSRADRIVALLDDPDLGVTTSVASLVIALVQDDPETYKMSYGKVIRRLQQLVFDSSRAPPEEYVYYGVPVPWLFVKLFRLLQYYPPSTDEPLQIAIRKVIFKVIEQNATSVKNVQQNNAQNAVLFEVINLAIHLDVDTVLLDRIVVALGQFLGARETNVRYLALNAMANLAGRYDQIPVKKYLITIIQSLKDNDISVRRKAIDLLYCLCDASNVRTIVSELLNYLQAADFSIRSEMVIRIAILVEKYAMEYQWYVDISLRLISIAGNHVSDEVWQRVIQIVVNNDNLQSYAAETVMKYLKQPNCPENMIKVGGYILGEYGHLVADNPGSEPLDQFLALHDKFPSCSVFSKGLLLNTYIKFVNLFVEIKPQLIQVFEFYSTSIDSELQQRACEYLKLATTDDQNPGLLAAVCDEIPPFPERASALLSRLYQKHAHSEDKRVWALGNKDAQLDRQALHLDASGPAIRQSQKDTLSPPITSPSSSEVALGPRSRAGSFANKAAPPVPQPRKGSIISNNGSSHHNPPPFASILSSNWEIGYRNLLTSSKGIFYKDSLIQIGLRSEYRRHLGCVILYYRNITDTPLNSLSVELSNPNGEDAVAISTKNFPDSTIEPNSSTQQVVIIDARKPFSEAPLIKITYMAGSLKVLNLKLPVVLEKFMEPADLQPDEFFRRWNQIASGQNESQKIFKGLSSSTPIDKIDEDPDNGARVKALNWSLIKNADKTASNIVGASVLHTSVDGNFGCLIRLEPNTEQLMYRVTVRATDDRIPNTFVKDISDIFQL